MYARQFSKKKNTKHVRIKIWCTKQLSKLNCGIGLKAYLNGWEIRVSKAILCFSNQRKKWKYWAFYTKKDLFASVYWETVELFLLFWQQLKRNSLYSKKLQKSRKERKIIAHALLANPVISETVLVKTSIATSCLINDLRALLWKAFVTERSHFNLWITARSFPRLLSSHHCLT